MNDRSKVWLKVSIFSIFVVIIIVSYKIDLFQLNLEYSTTRDTIKALDKGRFQITHVGDRRMLEDSKYAEDLVFRIEKYMVTKTFIYVIGYYSHGEIRKDGIWQPEPSYLDITTGGIYMYEDTTRIPRYLILNYKTADLRTHITWEEVTTEDKKIFNQKTHFFCRTLSYTCYESAEY